ncbi:SKI family transcriptional corepressor 1a isoform X2 [Denticeps clupeoides]|uniref:SKI family transcriptional corepressor 1a isoform X2 n=1 Tax=Denticeps clupeoides TaxID=299321 RepID=UPI0010A572F4|nr:SKI family transcriptional corepressor 1 homolog-B-like isoform X2 [Denticeps clupeoides]
MCVFRRPGARLSFDEPRLRFDTAPIRPRSPGMESAPNQLPSGRDPSSSPNPKQDLQPYSGSLKPNQVSETVLYGVPIVSLVIDGQERLCLAQISNTLLKSYSYNEIHNRRVALGITCVQCTPVQLEILRRAGAMPISSRRCGMITKREAERLCKSFLGAHNPPKLPENFAFDVTHECAWGSRGSFIPARYNSSRAKCIKCAYCSMYFSPNKFIFHSHRAPESKYTQPDAANFNSWRRHLKLTDKGSSDDVMHAWEDVKAMFNGGSRKRTMPMSGSDMSPSPLKPPAPGNRGSPDAPPHKALRCDDERAALGLGGGGARSYPVIPVPSKGFGVLQKLPPPLFPHPYAFPPFGLCPKKDDGVGGEPNKPGGPAVFWPGPKDALYPPFPVFWPAAGGLPVPPYAQAQPKPRQADADLAESTGERGSATPKDGERCSSSLSGRNEEERSGDEGQPSTPRKVGYVSAFRPVVKDAESIAKLYGAARAGYLSPDFASESSSYRSFSPDVESGDDPDVDVESSRIPDDEESIQLSVEDRQSPLQGLIPPQADPDQSPDPDSRAHPLEDPQRAPFSEAGSSDDERPSKPGSDSKDADMYEVCVHEKDGPRCKPPQSPSAANDAPKQHAAAAAGDEEAHQPRDTELLHGAKDATGDQAMPRVHFIEKKSIENMAKEELQKQLVEQVELRKKLEREFQSLKDNFQDQMKRELSYREEMVQQLQIVRDTLCNELDQERKARYAIQQKLKAHDALHHFSCKMLTPRHCPGSCTFKPPLLPP